VCGDDVIELTPDKPDLPSADAVTRGTAPEKPPDAPRRVRIVRYGAMGYLGEFSCKAGMVFGCGAKLVIQSERGIELGEPVGAPCAGCGCDLTVPLPQFQAYIKSSGTEFCRPRAGRILRIASEQDIKEHDHLNAHLRDDVDHCAEVAYQLGLDMKIITSEHLLGGERIVFYFSAPTRMDFRQLVKDLAQRYRTRIEMRQVGSRDEARLVGDYEVCGRECCCRGFLKKLRPVNMKMAKLQKSTLDPSKVSGRCGRLRCCLRYEHYGYEELSRRLPRVGSRIDTEFGPATVVDRQVLTQLVSARKDDDRVIVIPVEEIKAFDLPPLPPQPPPQLAASGGQAARPGSPDTSRRSRPRSDVRRSPVGRREGETSQVSRPASEDPSRFVEEEQAREAGEPASLPAEGPAAPTGIGADEASAAPVDQTSAAGSEGPVRRRRRRRRRRGRGNEPSSTASEGPAE
jgi:cell fate regulator YaaT (PSP1 superfamily)